MNPLGDFARGGRRRRERERGRGDARLFEHLGEVHALGEDEIELLAAIAAERQLTRLSEIFVRPSEILDSPDLERWSPEVVDALRARLSATTAAPSEAGSSEAGSSENDGEGPAS